MRLKNKQKSGAASFYIVAFSTLILMIIATSFAVAIVAEVTRSANDDLSQSAYDAALAGIEDAKLSFMNYQNCVNTGISYPDSLTNSNEVTCQDIVYWMNHPDCDMVGHILGRIGRDESGEVTVEEGSDTGENEMNQAYTCVTIKTKLDDYRASLSSLSPYRIIKVDLDSAHANDIKQVKISWYLNGGSMSLDYTNFLTSAGRVAFQPLNLVNASTPPTIALGLIQTTPSFTMTQLNGQTTSGQTDRATMYLVPTGTAYSATPKTLAADATYIGVYDSTNNVNTLSAAQVAATNDLHKDLPFVVYCPESTDAEYICSATINLPSPIGTTRSDDTFMLVVSLPYGQPETDFSLEFLCADGTNCGTPVGGGGAMGSTSVATLNGVQVLIDSTGRASDLFRRVEVRLEPADNTFTFPFYAVQVGEALEKDLTVTTEWNCRDWGAAQDGASCRL